MRSVFTCLFTSLFIYRVYKDYLLQSPLFEIIYENNGTVTKIDRMYERTHGLGIEARGGGGGGSPTPTPTSQDQLCRYVRTPVAYLCLHGNRLPSISTQYESVTSTIVLLLLPVLAYLYHEFHAFMRQTHGIYLNVAIRGCCNTLSIT